jgi:hypothetical protein
VTVPKLGVGGDFLFSATFKSTIVTPNCLGDDFTEGRRVCECQQKILNIVTKPIAKLINQRSFSPFDVAGKLLEFLGIDGGRTCPLLELTQLVG